MQYLVYMAAHGSMCLMGLLLNLVWFNSCFMHTLYVLVVLGAAMWNGANYYFHVFAPKYTKVLPFVSLRLTDQAG